MDPRKEADVDRSEVLGTFPEAHGARKDSTAKSPVLELRPVGKEKERAREQEAIEPAHSHPQIPNEPPPPYDDNRALHLIQPHHAVREVEVPEADGIFPWSYTVKRYAVPADRNSAEFKNLEYKIENVIAVLQKNELFYDNLQISINKTTTLLYFYFVTSLAHQLDLLTNTPNDARPNARNISFQSIGLGLIVFGEIAAAFFRYWRKLNAKYLKMAQASLKEIERPQQIENFYESIRQNFRGAIRVPHKNGLGRWDYSATKLSSSLIGFVNNFSNHRRAVLQLSDAERFLGELTDIEDVLKEILTVAKSGKAFDDSAAYFVEVVGDVLVGAIEAARQITNKATGKDANSTDGANIGFNIAKESTLVAGKIVSAIFLERRSHQDVAKKTAKESLRAVQQLKLMIGNHQV